MSQPRVLFSSVCKPIGPCVGDADSVGYELLHGQVTRSQYIYSPRVTHVQYALDYIAENLDTSSVVLQYPSKKAFVREVQKGYEVVAIGFALSTAHHAIAMCKLVCEHAPGTSIVLGGYGTVMSDEELLPHCDAICREEGVGFMRRFLGEPPLPVDEYRHPDIRSRLRLFGLPIGHTAMIFAGLGCPNGCDFCCTSHFFKRKHIRLLPSGSAIFDVMDRFQKKHSRIAYTVLDEDFLLNKKRAHAFLDRCRETNTSFSTFCFASIKALSQYTFDELLEMGIDGVWVGYEGKESGYAKHHGKDIDQLIRDLQDHGIMVLASMIVGIPYQSAEIAEKEFQGLIANRPALVQYLIYGPIPGTPFHEKVISEDLLQDDLLADRMKYYKQCTGFSAMVKHPLMERQTIEALQRDFYRRDFEILGPSVVRVGDVKLNGWLKYRNHPNPVLRDKAQDFRKKAAASLALLPVAMFGPWISFRNRLRYVKEFARVFRHSTWIGRLFTLAAPILAVSALVTWLKIAFGIVLHPITRIHEYPGRDVDRLPVKRLKIVWRNGVHRNGRGAATSRKPSGQTACPGGT
jgi:radical SAM superfamily enzyme YgiQ (UPF0313 family)